MNERRIRRHDAGGPLLLAGLAAVCLFLPLGRLRAASQSQSAPTAPATKILVDYPLDGSVFPPEITPPTFLFRDTSATAKRWVVEIHLRNPQQVIRIDAAGEHYRPGEIDTAVGTADEVLKLTSELSATRTWRPDTDTWAKIKSGSVRSPATVVIMGFDGESAGQPVSSGKVTLSTSPDPVGAPIMYRDVPLMLSPSVENGVIQPLPPNALPLIKWQLRDIAQPKSHTLMQNVPTCANCHSFSRHGATLGLDLDGPSNDKGLYAIVSVAKNTVIRSENVIRWSSSLANPNDRNSEPAAKRFGFMSQVSPDGRYVVTSIGAPGTDDVHRTDKSGVRAPERLVPQRLFSANYPEIRFGQVFYPMRGILAWYDRSAKLLRPLPGADDPRFVQAGAFWSPDGKYLVFSRAEARDPYPPGAKKATYANDPNEPQIQYDLYRIPFNEGRGGKAEPIDGASRNAMSNSFPKVSPDSRWIVFVQNRNGLLMRPDSKLYIVPFAGGKARLMKCNTSLMNSWHTFSPNGRWLAFSSKARSPYTQLMLTHMDADGSDTPAILIENTTAANRAVNIPEFADLGPSGLEKIDPQATEVYRLLGQALELAMKDQVAEAIRLLRQAEEQEPEEATVRFALARALSMNGQDREAVDEFRKACTLSPGNAQWHSLLAASLMKIGDPDGAVASLRTALEIAPSAEVELRLGALLFEMERTEEAYEHLRKATDLDPELSAARFRLGAAAARLGRMDEAVEQLKLAATLLPTSVDYQLGLGVVLDLRGDADGAVAVFRKAVELTGGRSWQPLAALAEACGKAGRFAEAARAARQALDLALQEHNAQLERSLREAVEQYEREAAKTQSPQP